MKKATILILAALFVSGCGNGEETENRGEPQMAEGPTTETQARREVRRTAEKDRSATSAPPRADDPARDIPKLVGDAPEEGHGLTMIVDGSSPEAFRQSLELIAEDTSEAQYSQLDSAIRYLRFYSPAGWGGLPALYESLDGMTGEEIIREAEQVRSRRRQ